MTTPRLLHYWSTSHWAVAAKLPMGAKT